MYVFAFDPGLTTGWALCKVDGAGIERITYGEADFNEVCEMMDAWFAHYSSDLVPVGEKYTITARTAQLSQQTWSLEVIGVARFLAHKYETKPLVIQPTNVKKFSTDKRLKAMGWWYKGGGGHANDALRHLMGYLVSIGWMDDRIA